MTDKATRDARVQDAIALLESELGEWGSISMRLGDEYVEAIRTLLAVVDAPVGDERK